MNMETITKFVKENKTEIKDGILLGLSVGFGVAYFKLLHKTDEMYHTADGIIKTQGYVIDKMLKEKYDK